jgi:hypothetical protein
MVNQVPNDPKIYHIVHVDRLPSIAAGGLWCDAEVVRRSAPGTTIGMNAIKQRRLNELTLASHPGLFVGECVPFYFCPRSIMLYLIYQRNHPDLAYRGGQGPIIHLESDLRQTVEWADTQGLRWAFTLGNAGSRYFEDRRDLNQLNEIDWNAIAARNWVDCKEGKQAEFLVERQFPWELVSRIGVLTRGMHDEVAKVQQGMMHKPVVQIRPEWYY